MSDIIDIVWECAKMSINITAFIVLAIVTARIIKEYKAKCKTTSERILFALGIIFNCDTFTSVFGLFFFSIFEIKSILEHKDITDYAIFNNYHSIWAMFYTKQNCVMLMILYLRIYYIFRDTSMALSNCTFWFFNICFGIALILFSLLPIFHIIEPKISIWTWCASTFCFYSIAFMIMFNSLFLYKLGAIYKEYVGVAMGRDIERNEQEMNEEQKMVRTFTKISILAVTIVSITICSCTVFILRFSLMAGYTQLNVLSECIVTIDIYATFLVVTLTYSYYDNIYYKVFGNFCDAQCHILWSKVLYKGVATTDDVTINTDAELIMVDNDTVDIENNLEVSSEYNSTALTREDS